MIRIFIGLVVGLIVVVGLQTWRLNQEKQEVELLESQNNDLQEGLKAAAISYQALEQSKKQAVELLLTRGAEREERIAELTEQNRRLAAVPDDGCLDRSIPDDVIRMLHRSGHNCIGAGEDLSTCSTDGGVSASSASGHDIPGSH